MKQDKLCIVTQSSFQKSETTFSENQNIYIDYLITYKVIATTIIIVDTIEVIILKFWKYIFVCNNNWTYCSGRIGGFNFFPLPCSASTIYNCTTTRSHLPMLKEYTKNNMHYMFTGGLISLTSHRYNKHNHPNHTIHRVHDISSLPHCC